MPDQFRYEFINDKIVGAGSFSQVLEIAGTLALEKDLVKYKAAGHNNKTRVVKIQCPPSKKYIQYITNESTFTCQAGYLASKELVWEQKNKRGFIVMRQLQGQNLGEILHNDYNGNPKLSFKERLAMTESLLYALKYITHINLNNIKTIHRDLKPQNISIHRVENSSIAYIFDFGFSKLVNQSDDRHPGSPNYAPPEIFNGGIQTEKIDVFSLARTIAILWRADTKTYTETDINKSKENAQKNPLPTLFHNLPEVDAATRSILTKMLTRMLQSDPNQRSTIEEAIECFAEIRQRHHPVFNFSLFGKVPMEQNTTKPSVTTYEDLCMKHH